MKIKDFNLSQSPLNQFDLLGTDEIGLSKAFAYLLGKEPKVLYKFLHFIGVKENNTSHNYLSTVIEIERYRDSSRTDIELKQTGKYHVIIESKVKNNKIKNEQRVKYTCCFEPVPQKILCFITGVNNYKKVLNEDIKVINLSWIEIVNLFDTKEFISDERTRIVKDFLSFMKRGYKMREQREILVQDLGDLNEIERFRNCQVYRRDVVYGSPLYFAPYFTRKAKQADGEGIVYLSKILGILTLNPKNISSYLEDLPNFSEDTNLHKKWINGITMDKEDRDFTYFLLDEPLKLKIPLRKDGTREKGRGKDWIAAMISKNRCVTFHEFIKRINEVEDDTET